MSDDDKLPESVAGGGLLIPFANALREADVDHDTRNILLATFRLVISPNVLIRSFAETMTEAGLPPSTQLKVLAGMGLRIGRGGMGEDVVQPDDAAWFAEGACGYCGQTGNGGHGGGCPNGGRP